VAVLIVTRLMKVH